MDQYFMKWGGLPENKMSTIAHEIKSYFLTLFKESKPVVLSCDIIG